MLVPRLVDAQGTLVKPTAALAPAVVARCEAFVKSATLCRESQIARLERAMVAERTWTVPRFVETIASHPVVRLVARRLVWSMSGPTPTFFRIADGRAFVDARDAAIALDPSSRDAIWERPS